MPVLRLEDNPQHNGQFLCILLYTLMLESYEQYVPHFLKHTTVVELICTYDMFFSRISLLQHPNVYCGNIHLYILSWSSLVVQIHIYVSPYTCTIYFDFLAKEFYYTSFLRVSFDLTKAHIARHDQLRGDINNKIFVSLCLECQCILQKHLLFGVLESAICESKLLQQLFDILISYHWHMLKCTPKWILSI